MAEATRYKLSVSLWREAGGFQITEWTFDAPYDSAAFARVATILRQTAFSDAQLYAFNQGTAEWSAPLLTVTRRPGDASPAEKL